MEVVNNKEGETNRIGPIDISELQGGALEAYRRENKLLRSSVSGVYALEHALQNVFSDQQIKTSVRESGLVVEILDSQVEQAVYEKINAYRAGDESGLLESFVEWFRKRIQKTG